MRTTTISPPPHRRLTNNNYNGEGEGIEGERQNYNEICTTDDQNIGAQKQNNHDHHPQAPIAKDGEEENEAFCKEQEEEKVEEKEEEENEDELALLPQNISFGEREEKEEVGKIKIVSLSSQVAINLVWAIWMVG